MIAPALLLTGILAWPGDGKPGIEVIKVSIDDSCAHDITESRTVKREDRDVLIWRVQSECDDARKVLICIDPAPPLKCTGDPETAMLGTQFQIDAALKGANVRNYIACTVKWPAQKEGYSVKLYTGPASANLTCPTIQPEDYELALEVVP